jgi:hypothetical protein
MIDGVSRVVCYNGHGKPLTLLTLLLLAVRVRKMQEFVTFFPCMLNNILKFILGCMEEENANIIYCCNRDTRFCISDPNMDVFCIYASWAGGP